MDIAQRALNSHRRNRDVTRALVATLCLAALFALGILLSGWSASPIRSTGISDDDDLRTGSILSVPVLGNNCRQRLIDNATWRIRDNGIVDCDVALSRSARVKPSQWSAARAIVIREGFVKK